MEDVIIFVFLLLALIDIDNYEKVTYDYENERILIAID